jgi:hypothetical protein
MVQPDATVFIQPTDLVVGERYEVLNAAKMSESYGVFKFFRLDKQPSHLIFWGYNTTQGNQLQCGDCSLILFKAAGCQHEFKLYKGFRSDEWCCTKCPKTYPFNIYRDAI